MAEASRTLAVRQERAEVPQVISVRNPLAVKLTRPALLHTLRGHEEARRWRLRQATLVKTRAERSRATSLRGTFRCQRSPKVSRQPDRNAERGTAATSGEGKKMQDITVRLQQLERREKQLRACVVALASIMAGGLLMGAAVPKQDVVAARNFAVVDSNGRIRASWGLAAEDERQVSFGMKNETGQYLFMLNVVDGEFVGGVRDADGTNRFLFGDTGIEFRDRRNTRRVVLSEGDGLTLYDAAGVKRAKLSSDVLLLADDRSQPRVGIGVRGTDAFLHVLGPSGAVLLSVP